MALSLPQHLLKTSFDVVKRWVNEAQEAASSDNIMVQVGNPLPTQGLLSREWSKLPELSQALLCNRGDKSRKNTPQVCDDLFPCTVSCSGLTLPCAEE